VGEGFNVDHVIIGPAGAFTIETKTWSKPKRGSPTISFDGETLRAAGYAQASVGNPAEDGSVTAQYDGSGLRPGCRAQVTARPQGSLTVMLVLVAAACAP
jgi:hypothetical protein